MGKYRYQVEFYAAGVTGECLLTRDTKIKSNEDVRGIVAAIEARGAKDVIIKEYKLIK